MTEITELKAEIDEDLLRNAKWVLEKVEAGEIVSCAFALIYKGGDVGGCIVSNHDAAKMLGSMDMLKHTFLHRVENEGMTVTES